MNISHHTRRIPLIFSVLVLSIGGWLHAGSAISHPYRGVTQIVRTEASPRSEHINVMQIDLTTPGIRFLVSNGNNPVNSTNCEVTTAKTLDYMTAQNGQIAINAHFFQAFSGSDPVSNKWVVGLAASQGYVYSSFEGPTPAAANPTGSLTLTQDYAIMTNAPALNIDAQNHAQIVHYDANFPDNKHVLEPVSLCNALCGSAQIVTNGVKTIPTYTGNAATGLISGTSGYSDSDSWYNRTNARTAIGLSSDNHTLTLFTIDNAGGSSGMSVGEVADMLQTDYKVWNALNLDGGGSTTMALQDPVSKARSVINTSSNGATPRIVATSLVVFAEPRIAVEQPAGTGLTNGSAMINCGSVSLGGTSGPITFTVKNNGAADLTGLTVTRDGTNAADYMITAPQVTSILATGSTTFTVAFKPAATGNRSAVLHIASNDPTQNPFDINLTGVGAAPADGGFSSWAVTMGLGADADPMAAPKGDGVNNLLKFAFNMDPEKADTRCLSVGSGQTAGLPGINLIGGPVLQMEFIRRKASTHPGITYTAQFGSDLTVWDVSPDPIIPVSIDEMWERVTVPDFSSFAPRFARVVVSQP